MSDFRLFAAAAVVLATMAACSDDNGVTPIPEPDPDPGKDPVVDTRGPLLSIAVDVTKVTGNVFDKGDVIGLYMVNYEDGSSVTLGSGSPYLDNVAYAYDGSSWITNSIIYWKDDNTHADFYVYYPKGDVSSPTSCQISTNTDQSSSDSYKANEILWGKTADVAPSSNAVQLNMKHMMSKLDITVVPGDGFTEESLGASSVAVTVNAVKPVAVLNIAEGTISAKGDSSSITPLFVNGVYKALLVPQEISSTSFITVNIDGKDYNLSNNVTLESGRSYVATVKVNKTSSGINVGIGDWDQSEGDLGGNAE